MFYCIYYYNFYLYADYDNIIFVIRGWRTMCKFNKKEYPFDRRKKKGRNKSAPTRPQSLRSRLLELVMRLLNVKKYFTRAFEKGEHGSGASKVPPRIFFAELKFRKTRFRGRNVYTVRPSVGNSGTHIMLFHGGGYINGFHLTHWTFIRALATETRCTVIAPDYPLAPKSTYKEVFDMVVPMYEKLVRKVGCSKVILMGDSAGGGDVEDVYERW